MAAVQLTNPDPTDKVMSGGEAAQTLRDSAVRINHRLRRFAGANALKKIALNVIAKVRIHDMPDQVLAMSPFITTKAIRDGMATILWSSALG